MRHWLGYYGNEDAEIDIEQYTREHPDDDPDPRDDRDRGERMYEAWIGGEA